MYNYSTPINEKKYSQTTLSLLSLYVHAREGSDNSHYFVVQVQGVFHRIHSK